MINEDESVITFFITGHGSEFISREYEFDNLTNINAGLKNYLKNNVSSYVAAGSPGMCSWYIGKADETKTNSEKTYDIAKSELELHPNEPTDIVINTYVQPKIQTLYISELQKIKLEYEEIIKTKVREGMDIKEAESNYKVNIYNNHYRQIRPIYEKIYQIRSYDITNPRHEFYNFSIINYKSNKSYINYLFQNMNFYDLLNAIDNIKINFLTRYYEICFTRPYRQEFNAYLENVVKEDNKYIYDSASDENKQKEWIQLWCSIAKVEIFIFFIKLLNISFDVPHIKDIYNDLNNRVERLIYRKEKEYNFYYIINEEFNSYAINFFFENKKNNLDFNNRYGKFDIKLSELARIFRLLGFNFIYIIDETCRMLDSSLIGRANIGYGIDIPFGRDDISARTQRATARAESRKIRYTRKKNVGQRFLGGKRKRKNKKTRKNKK